MPFDRRAISLAIVVPLFLAASCTDGDNDNVVSVEGTPTSLASVLPILASSEMVVGENRFLIGLQNSDGDPMGSPEIEVHASFLRGKSETPKFSDDMEFVWIDEPERGLYVLDVELTKAGPWSAQLVVTGPGGLDSTIFTQFEVVPEGTIPAPGDDARSVETPTTPDTELSRITGDPDPEPRFYETSIAGALAAGEPFVVVFASSQVCDAETCEPMLDLVKEVAEDFPDMTFIHVEPYDLAKTKNPKRTEAARTWGVAADPWTFVVDGEGLISARFEDVFTAAGLGAVLNRL